MSRARTGTLVLKNRAGVPTWFGQVTTEVDGKPRRLWYNLETSDKPLARRKLRELVRALTQGEEPAAVELPDTVREYAEAWLQRREAQGLSCAKDEMYYLRHVLPVIGDLPLKRVR